MRTRVLVADAIPLVGAGVDGLLARHDDFECAHAHDLDSALDAVALFVPHIALVDLDLPPVGGIVAVSKIAAAAPSVAIVVWSLQPAREAVLESIRAGARGFLGKDVSGDGLLRALRGARHGEAPLSRALTHLVIDEIRGFDERQRAWDLAARLSEREHQVLVMIRDGARNREIAEVLSISEFTVKRHVQNILHKLGLPSRSSAAAFYRSTFGDGRPELATFAGAGRDR
jgi:two-component system nitrate/nitrite response regulator NarL